MDVFATILSVIVLIALVVIAIVLFVYVNKMGYAIKNLQQKVDIIDARNYDNDVLLDSDVKALKTGLSVTSSNVTTLGRTITVTSSNLTSNLNTMQRNLADSDVKLRQTDSNNLAALTLRDSQFNMSLCNLASNCVRLPDIQTNGLTNIRTNRLVLGPNYTFSNINTGNLSVQNATGAEIISLNAGTRGVVLGGNLVVPGKTDLQQICSFNVCADSNTWGRMVAASR